MDIELDPDLFQRVQGHKSITGENEVKLRHNFSWLRQRCADKGFGYVEPLFASPFGMMDITSWKECRTEIKNLREVHEIYTAVAVSGQPPTATILPIIRQAVRFVLGNELAETDKVEANELPRSK